MSWAALAITLLNLLFVVWRVFSTLRQKRLIAVFWMLVAYFSLFMVFPAIGGSFTHRRGFSNDLLVVEESTIIYSACFVLLFNMLFAVAEATTWKLFGYKAYAQWSLGRKDLLVNSLRLAFGLSLAAGAALYWYKMRGLGYRGYVEYDASNWPSVFFSTGSVFITLSMMQRKFKAALLGTMSFLFFALYLHIRSFALSSLIPAVIIFFYQLITNNNHKKHLNLKTIFSAGIIVIVLLAASNAVTYLKGSHEDFPDAGMPYGMNMVFQSTLRTGSTTGWTSLSKYSVNIAAPFYKLFGIPIPIVEDTPEFMARIIEGVPKGYRVYFHFPTLWYSDAFISFKKWGLWLAALWGVILSLQEAILGRNSLIMALMLPFYTWHAYMICRGATAIATAPISYCFYIVVIISSLICVIIKSTNPREVKFESA